MRVSTLSERIANEINKRILDGELAPQAHLRAEQLSEAFGVSRSPIRQALQLLESRGVLEQKVNRGFFVREGVASQFSHAGMPDQLDAPDVHYRLADDWLNDRIPQEVTEQFLRDRYKLTKAQVIEILSRAANEGWAERKEGRGWRFLVVAKATETLEQIYRFRAIVEPAGLLEPTFSLDRASLAEQRRVQEAMFQGEIERMSPDRLLMTGTNFHEALARMSNNSFVYQAVVRANRMRRLLNYRTLVDRDRFYDQARDHLRMVDLLERGENLECSFVLKRHLSGALMQRAVWQKMVPMEDDLAEPARRKNEPV
jgi:DNA-binding GntR family transcriptional regulator